MFNMRINKYLSEAGYCSRRQADSLVEAGRVFVNGKRAKLGDQIEQDSEVKVDSKIIGAPSFQSKKVYLAYHKPVGVICTSATRSPNNIIDVINYPVRIFLVGRLDVASTGLIFLTNDGEWTNQLTHPKFEHPKEYEVTVDKPIGDKSLKGLVRGVMLTEGLAKADSVVRVGDNMFRIIIHQGWNKQIRRMLEVGGYQAKILKRIRIGQVALGDLKSGQWRPLTQEEVESFK